MGNDDVTERTYRCGWRYSRHDGDMEPFARVVIRRGEWQLVMPIEVFDSMPDKSFADYIGHCYRNGAFEHLEADLDVLARQLIGELEAGNGLLATDVPHDDIKAALYRWQKVQRDMQEPAS